MAHVARAKVRSRKDGAAVPLDDTDKQLLNLMQGKLPARAPPVQGGRRPGRARRGRRSSSASSTCSTSGSSARSRRSSTRARSATQSMLVAAKVDPAFPHRAAQFINTHPGVTHNYLRDHDFNLWFTIAVEPDSALGLRRHARRDRGQDRRGVHPPAADAQALQDPHGPRDGGRDGRAEHRGRGDGADGARADRAERGGRRHGPRDAGPDARRARALRARGRASSASRRRRCSSAWRRCASAAACAASRRSSTTVAPASPRTAWACGRCPTTRSSRPASGWPPSAASRTATSARPTRDWPYSVFTMAHGRSKEECDAVLDAIADDDRHRAARDAVLEHGVQEGADALLHRRVRALGAGARVLTSSLSDTRSAELYRRALGVLPGGVNSPVRAMRAIGRDPIFIERAEGAEIYRRRRQRLRRLRLLLGAADPRPRRSRR